MLSNLMIFAGALLMGFGGNYIARHVEGGSWSNLAVIGFAIGIIWLSQAPVIALRKRVRELEAKVGGKSSSEIT
jgi:hypothetical protein